MQELTGTAFYHNTVLEHHNRNIYAPMHDSNANYGCCQFKKNKVPTNNLLELEIETGSGRGTTFLELFSFYSDA